MTTPDDPMSRSASKANRARGRGRNHGRAKNQASLATSAKTSATKHPAAIRGETQWVEDELSPDVKQDNCAGHYDRDFIATIEINRVIVEDWTGDLLTGWRWHRKARAEFEAARRKGRAGSIFAGETRLQLEGLRDGWIVPRQGPPPILVLSVPTDEPWSILMVRIEDQFVGLYLLQCKARRVPAAAFDVAINRLENLEF